MNPCEERSAGSDVASGRALIVKTCVCLALLIPLFLVLMALAVQVEQVGGPASLWTVPLAKRLLR